MVCSHRRGKVCCVFRKVLLVAPDVEKLEGVCLEFLGAGMVSIDGLGSRARYVNDSDEFTLA